MKNFFLFFFCILFSLPVFAGLHFGNLIQLSPGSYRIAYPDQAIDIFFDHIPVGAVENVKVDIYLTENEKHEIAKILKQQIDQLPEAFIGKYLNREIYGLQINDRFEYGINTDKGIIVEITKIKQGMSYGNSLKSALAHQIAHIIENEPDTKNDAGILKNYLNTLYQMNYHKETQQRGFSIYDKGFVSRYANGELSGQYSSSEEFAEIFAHLVCNENRSDVIEYLTQNPQNVLGVKVSRLIDFLDEHVSSLSRAYFMGEDVVATYSLPINANEDGEMLLAAHELRSYGAFDFSATNSDENVWEFKEKSSDSAEVDYTEPHVYNSENSYHHPESNNEESQMNANNYSSGKSSTKKKGGGWIWVAAVIALLVVSN
jgi:hypothetical protein